MASLWQRLTGAPVQQTRAAQPTIPTRLATSVTPDSSLTLTAVYRAVQIIATPVSKMNIDTFRYATGLEAKIENPLLVNRPNLDDTRRDFLFQTVVSLALEGNAFWYKQYGSNGQVNNLTILPASAVSVSQDSTTARKTYNYEGKTYTSNEIEHLRLFPRAGYLRGISPIESCSADLAAALDLRDYAKNWFSSAGVPTGILKTGQMVNQADAELITTNWHNKQQNRQIAVLGSGFEFQEIQVDPAKAQFTEQQAQAVQQIARLFGVPARLLLTGIDGTSDTYSNLSDENQVFYRHTLMAYTDAISDALSNCLPRGTRSEFNFESLFRADQASRFNMWNTALAGEAFMTVEEVRNKEGLNV